MKLIAAAHEPCLVAIAKSKPGAVAGNSHREARPATTSEPDATGACYAESQSSVQVEWYRQTTRENATRCWSTLRAGSSATILILFVGKARHMDVTHFDSLVRTLAQRSFPRRLLHLTGLAALVASAIRLPDVLRAKKRKKLRVNQFGCVNVGGRCRGNDGACCSGICAGKKPKKGKKDKRRCVAHDASTCVAGQHPAECGGADVPCVTSLGSPGVCATTTGNAGYCFNAQPLESPLCARDTDCQAFFGGSFGCIVCPLTGNTRCVRIANGP
jgi:hypothetical protein